MGGTALDFAHASMEDWKTQVSEALSSLRKTNERVYIAAHSMGTLFALQEAAKAPFEALFLLNVPLVPRVSAELIKMCAKVYSGRVKPDDEWGRAAQSAYSIAPDKNPLHYLGWLPRYAELFAEMARTRRLLD